MAAEGIPFIHSANQSQRCPAGEGLLGDRRDDFSELGRVLSDGNLCSPKACNRKLPKHLGAEVFLRSNVEFVIPRSPEFQAEVNAALSDK